MRKLLLLVFALALPAFAQNYTNATATNIVDASGTVQAGKLCARATNEKDVPISFTPGGGGQAVDQAVCNDIVSGASTLTLASPDNTTPTGIYYRFTISTKNGVTVCKKVTWHGATFSFDNYPCNSVSIPTEGGTVNGDYVFAGNVTINGTCTGCGGGTGGSSPQVQQAGVNVTPIRSKLNMAAPLTAVDDAANARTNIGIVTPISTANGGVGASNTGAAGKVLIGNGTAFVEGDPLVQGVFAEGNTTAQNPVNVGGFDTAGTPAIHGAKVISSNPAGTEYGMVVRPIPNGTQQVSASSLPLPTGAATETTLSSVNGKLNSLGQKTMANSTPVVVASDQSAIPVSAASLPLPSGASTSANQTTGNSSLSSIDTKKVQELTADYDTGAGTQNMLLNGIALPASGGAVAGGTATNPVRIDPTGTTTQPVSGTVTSNQGTAAAGSGAWPVAVTDTANTVVKPGDSGNNAIRVNVVAGAGSGGTATADGGAFTAGTTNGTPAEGVRDDTASTTCAEDKACIARLTQNRAIHVNLRDAAGNEVSVGGGTQYTEDAASAADPVGTQLIGRRRDTLSTETTTDGDVTAVNTTGKGEIYVKHVDAIPVTDNGGSLTVDASSLPLPTGAATLAEQQTQTTSLQLLDDAVSTTASAVPTKSHQVSGTDGTNARVLKTDTNGELQIDVLTLPALSAGTNNIGDVDVLTLPSIPAGSNLIGKAGFDTTTAGTTNGVSMFQPSRTTGTITTSTSTVSVATTGYGSSTITITGTHAGINFTFEFSDDGGTTWYPMSCTRTDTNSVESATGVITSNASRAWDCGVFATTNVRVRATAYTSGTGNIGVTLSAAPIEPAQTVQLASGSAVAATQSGTWATNSTPTAATSGGCTIASTVSAASTNATSTKASAGQVYSVVVTNTNAAVRYFKLYNKASAPTVGTDTPVFRVAIPASTTGGGIVIPVEIGMTLTTGIAWAVTTGAPDSDTGAVGANELLVNLCYK